MVDTRVFRGYNIAMEYKNKKVFAIDVYLIDDFLKKHNLTNKQFADFCNITEQEFLIARYKPDFACDDVFDKIFRATKIKPEDYFRFTLLPKRTRRDKHG